MAFELFTTDKFVARGVPMVTITSYGRISLNKNATARFESESVKFVQLMWDAENRKVGIRPASGGKGSSKLSFGNNGNGANFSSTPFLMYLEYDWTMTRNFEVEWNKEHGMYVFEVPALHLGKAVPVSHANRASEKRRSKLSEEMKEPAFTGS